MKKKTTSFRAQLDRFDAPAGVHLSADDLLRLQAVCRECLGAAKEILERSFPGSYDAYAIAPCLNAWIDATAIQSMATQAAAAWFALDFYHGCSFKWPGGLRNPEQIEAFKEKLIGRTMQLLQANLGDLLAHLAASLALPHHWISPAGWSRRIKGELEQFDSFKIADLILELHLAHGGLAWNDQLTREQWTRLKTHIDAGRPWPIILLGQTQNLHQHKAVVAYGYKETPEGNGIILSYDPAFPQVSQQIRIDFRARPALLAESGTDSRSEPLFGFFCCDYTPASPPRSGWSAFFSAILPFHLTWHAARRLRLGWLWARGIE